MQIPPTTNVAGKSVLQVFYQKPHFQPILPKKHKKKCPLNLNKSISQSKTPIKQLKTQSQVEKKFYFSIRIYFLRQDEG